MFSNQRERKFPLFSKVWNTFQVKKKEGKDNWVSSEIEVMQELKNGISFQRLNSFHNC